MPTVSVIIPTYNRSNLLKEAIESVLQQSYTDLELLVIDDGSTDNTCSVVQKCLDNRIKYHFQKNAGQSSARNLGILKGKGIYVAFLDEDDLWPKDYLKTVITQLEANNEFGATYTRVTLMYPDGTKKELGTEKRCRSGQITKFFFDYSPCLMPSATCFRKSVWKDFFWDEALKRSPDYDVFLRISTRTKFLFVPDTNIIKRQEADSLSTAFNPIGMIDAAHILERFYFQLGGNKYVSAKLAKRKISHRYRKAAKISCSLGNKNAAIELYKKAIRSWALDFRLYFEILKTLLMKNRTNTISDWQMPEPLPPYITVNQKVEAENNSSLEDISREK